MTRTDTVNGHLAPDPADLHRPVAGGWTPNVHGGRENLEVVRFLREMNATMHKTAPGIVTITEESTSWPDVTHPTELGGLGFSMKWNMGWMNDTPDYISRDRSRTQRLPARPAEHRALARNPQHRRHAYRGAGAGDLGGIDATEQPWHGRPE